MQLISNYTPFQLSYIINYRQRNLNALRVLKVVRIIKLLDPQFEKGIFPLADRLENQ